MQFFNGMLSTAGFLGVLAAGMYVNNIAVRSWACHRIQASGGNHLTAEALLLGF